MYKRLLFVNKPPHVVDEHFIDSSDNHPMAIYMREKSDKDQCKSRTLSIWKYEITKNWLAKAKIWKPINICFYPPEVTISLESIKLCDCESQWIPFEKAV